MSRLLLRGARQLVTLRGPSSPRRGVEMNELAVIDDGSLLIENGIIQAVGPSRRLENLSAARGAKILDASGRVVLPGFVDASTHLLKAIQQDNRSWAAARLQSEIRRGLRWFARHGTTTIETSTTSLREIKVIEGLKAKPLDIVASLCAHTAEQVDGLPKKAGTPLVACAHSGPGALTSAGVRDYVAAARRNGYIPRVYGPGTAGIALECGAAVLQACGRMADSEIALIAHSATITLIGPLEMGLEGEAPAPARRLLDAGAAIALATGFNATGTRTLSMAVLISQAVTALGLTPEEAIAASTINAAHALTMARAVGSLEVGKYADFVMFDCSDYRDIPSLFGANLVCMVAKRGVLLYEDSE